jgi:hypothetical protein
VSHQYAGNPNSYPSAVTLCDDGVDTPSFVNFNVGYEGALDRTAYLYARGVGAGLLNWRAAVSPTSAWASVAYDSFHQRWVAVDGNSGSSSVLYVSSIDGGQTWTASPDVLTGSGSAFFGIACDASGITYIVFPTTGPDEIVFLAAVDPSAGDLGVVAVPATSGNLFYDPTASRAVLIAASQVSGTFTAALYDFVSTGAHTSPTITTHTLPAGWVSGTNHVGQFYSATSTSQVISLIAMGGVTPGTDTPQLLVSRWTGSTYVFVPVTSLSLAGKIIVGVGWNGSFWAVAAYDGTNTTFYTSQDLITWTTQSTIAGQSSGLASVGGMWLMANVDPLVSTYRPYVSPDGGVTWRAGAFSFGGLSAVQSAVGANQAIMFAPATLTSSLVFGAA